MRKLNALFHPIDEVISEIKRGRMVIMLDDEDRENEGDLIMAASLVEPHHITFMATHGRGLICTPVSEEIAKRLELPPMVNQNSSQYSTAFTVSIDAKENISTGISSFDRAHTIELLTKHTTQASDFIRPGHIFPLIAKEGGVLTRPGHTEASVDLARLAGLPPVGVICEILKSDGTMMRRDDLLQMAKEFNLKISSIKLLQEYLEKKNHVEIMADIDFPNKYGNFRMAMVVNPVTKEEHQIIYKGNLLELKNNQELLVRMHSECFTGDIFGSDRCDCGEQLAHALKRIDDEGQGMVIYLRQEGRGIGLLNKMKAYSLQDQGMDTVEANLHLGFKADERTYDFAVDVLKKLGISSIQLLSNNPVKMESLNKAGIQVKREAIQATAKVRNYDYLLTKKLKMGHLLDLAPKGNTNEYH